MKKTLRDYGINFIAVVIAYFAFRMVMAADLINNYVEGVMVFAMINIIVAISLNIATGYLGQLALGHAGFMAVGAYTAGLFVKAVEWPLYVEMIAALALAGMVAGVFGLIIGIPALRLRGDYLGIVTLGFGEMIRYSIINLGKWTGGASGLKRIPKMVTLNEVFIVLIIVVAFPFLFIRSRHGRAIISIR